MSWIPGFESGYAVKAKAAIFVSGKIRLQKLRLPSSFGSRLQYSFHIFAIAALTLNILATGIPGLIASYNNAQAHNPKPLAADINTASALTPAAADAKPVGDKTIKLPDNLKAQLASDLKNQQDGKAQDHTHVKELDEGRTATDRVYLNADGTNSLVRSFQATSFKDPSGKWQDVDSTLAQDKTSGKWTTRANSWSSTFGDISTDGVQVSQNGQTFKFSPVGGNNVRPTVTGASPDQLVTYKNVWQGVDLQYKVSGSELKESIIIKSKVAQSSFDFAAIGANLSPNPATPGSFSLDGAFTGFTIAAATVDTSNGASVGKLPDVEQSFAGGHVHVSLDAAWLKAQAPASFPVIIDPTLTYGPSAPADYYNFSSAGASCHGSVACSGGQAVGKQGSVNWRSAIQTNLTGLPAGEFPLGANLHLATKSGATAASTINIDKSTCQTSWTCYDTSWGDVSASVGTSADIDVTSLYQSAMGVGNTSPWMMIRGVETGSTDTYKVFDDTQTSITIVYEHLPSQSVWAAGSPADTGTAVTTQPTFFSKKLATPADDPDGPGPFMYRYIVGTSGATAQNDPYHVTQGVGGVLVNSGQLNSAQWTMPDNTLQDGNTYYWQATVWDGLGGAPEVYGPVYSFKVDLRNGNNSTQAYDSAGPVNVDLGTGNLTASTETHSIGALGGNLGVNLNYNSPQRSRQGLVGTYYNDPTGTRTFPASSVAPTMQRVDANVDFNWGSGSPSAGLISTDNFLVRWTGYFVAPQNGTYQFGTSSDDGSRMFLNGSGTTYIDQWSANPTNVFGSTMVLTTGQLVPITYEYFEAGGAANAHLLVKTSDLTINGPAQSLWLQTGIRPIATPHGLVGRYYTDPSASRVFPTQDDPTRLFLTRTDVSLNENWGTGSPVPGGPSDNFLVRWTGTFTAPTNDTYTFGANSDDGIRIIANGTTVVNNWTDHGPTVNYATSGMALTAGQSIPITIEYYENSGGATMQFYLKRLSLPSAPNTIVDPSFLSPQAQVLPDGWSLGIDADGNLNYDYAIINQTSVSLHDSDGESHEYKFVNGGFVPPNGEEGHMVRNGDSTITFQDSDGRTYVFSPNGTIESTTTPADDLHPTALRYTYGGNPLHLQQITDGVTTSRWLKIAYTGDATNACSPPPNSTNAAPTGMICGVTTSDGQATKFGYINDANTPALPRLARIERPGTEITDYGYDATLGRIAAVRDSLAYDALVGGQRTADNTVLTQIGYDGLGRVNTVTMPAATTGATQIVHTYNYYPQNYTYVHVSGAAEPNGFTRKVAYDATLRTTDDTDVANLNTHTAWDPAKDLVLSSTDPAGLMSTTLYDYALRPTDKYGPAPAAWFGTDRKPLITPTDYTPQVPHTQTGYDEGINGLAAAYYNVDTYTSGTGQPTKALFGNPKLHGTGVGPVNGDVNKTWGATPPFTADAGKGWGMRLSGWIHTTAAGIYNFRITSDDGVRLWIDDASVIDDWQDGPRTHPTGTFNNTASPADSWHRVRLDYYNKYSSTLGTPETDANLTLFMTSPGGTETSSLGSLLKPGYGLTTTQTTYDSGAAVGNSTTITSYGPNPELGLAQTSTVDPTGLNLTTTNTYEAQNLAGGFLRQLSKTLPGGVTTSYAYYGANETRDNPCTTGTVEAYNQAGRQKLTTGPDPDNAGSQTPITTETIYDDAGRVVATRFNAESNWTCTTYDTRSRVTQIVTPAQANTAHVTRSARTLTYSYNSGGSWGPFQTSISDSGFAVSPDISIIVDLLGRMTDYNEIQITGPSTSYGHGTHYTYDNLGRLSTKAAGAGTFTSAITETYGYDNLNRLSSYKQNGTTVATPTYDSMGRLNNVTYPTAGSLAVSVGRDTLGRTNNYNYTLGNGTTHISDAITLSQSSQVVSGTEVGAAKTYTYDKADRLTAATLGTHTFGYNFSTPTTCTGTYNANAGKDANRTSSTIDGTTKTYCYDYADRLTSSSDTNNFGTVTYDAHGNISSGSSFTKLEYDSSDRSAYAADLGGSESLFKISSAII